MLILLIQRMNTSDNNSETRRSESSRADLKSAFAPFQANRNNVYVCTANFRDGHYSVPFVAFSPSLATRCFLEYANMSPVLFEGSELICVGVFDTSTGVVSPVQISLGTLTQIVNDEKKEDVNE